MGTGYRYVCSKCKEEYEVFQGIGMLFPTTYKNLVDKIKKGEYGKEWKELFETTKNVAVDAETHIYCCSECRSWNAEPGISLYVAVNDSAIEDVKNGYAVFYDDDSIPAMMGNKPEYRLLKEYEHKCKKCGSVMHETGNEEICSLPCPKCGSAPDMEHFGIINWD